MKEFLSLAVIFWTPAFIVIFKSVLWDLYFWQIKEYRLDRYWIHIRWDQESANRNIGDLAIKFLLFALVSTFLIYPETAVLGIVLSFAYWFNQAVFFVYRFKSGKVRRPSLKNPRNIIIISLILISVVSLFSAITIPFAVIDRQDTTGYNDLISASGLDDINVDSYLFPDVYLFLSIATSVALLIDLAVPLLVAFFVLVTYPLARFKRQRLIKKAKDLIASQNKDLIIVGITGSEGKTTTKEILYEILKSNYKVIKTEENFNTDVGVAISILNNLKKDSQVLVAEMGALRKGEISAIVKAFRPDISIVTSLDRQHVGLFGSKQKLFEAKSEIVAGMKPSGTAILNADNHEIRDMHSLHSGKSIFVTTQPKIFKKYNDNLSPRVSSSLIKETSSNANALKLTLKTEEQTEIFTIPQQGDHLFMNIALAISAAHELEIPLKKIKSALEKMDFKLPRQEVLKGDNNTIIINDTYNSSFNGFLAAVERMNKLKSIKADRIIVTKGIFELGRYKSGTYEELMSKIKSKFDILITTDSELYTIARRNNVHAHITLISKPEEMLYEIRKHMNHGNVILLEGRLSPIILQDIVSENS